MSGAGASFGPWPGTAAGGGSEAQAKFVSTIFPSDAGATFDYMADSGQTNQTINETNPQLYPTGARTIQTLRAVLRSGGPTGTTLTVTLYKNGAPTAQTVSFPPGSVDGAEFVDTAHPIAFANGDQYDLRIDAPLSDQGPAAISATLESVSATVAPVLSVNGQVGAVTDPVFTNGITTGSVQLSALASTGFGAGALAWVDSVGAYFQLQQSALTVDNITVVAATGKGGFQWARLQLPNRVFWAISVWHIDPVNGSDEAAGTGTGANALKTCAEWNRRTLGVQSTGTVTLNLDNDIPDTDSIVARIDCALVIVVGGVTVASTQTVASATARTAGTTPGTSAANSIVVTGFDFSPFLNSFLRVQGTNNYAAITKVLTTNTANDTARLGELWNTLSSTQASSTGVGAGAVIEIVTTRKGPLSIISQGNSPISTHDVRQDGAGPAVFQVSTTAAGGAVLLRHILGGTSASVTSPASLVWFGGLVKTSGGVLIASDTMQGTAFTATGGVSFVSPGQSPCYPKLRSTVWQGTTVILASALCHIDGDFGQFDLPAAAVGVSVNGSGVGEGALMHFNSGRHYGSGNNAAANMWSVGFGSYVAYLAAQPPTMDAGNGIAINGGNVAIGSLPVNLSLTNGSAVYAL